MTHSNEPEFLPCFVRCDCGEEYSLQPPDFLDTADKECRCTRNHVIEQMEINKHLNGTSESSYAAQYQQGSGGRL